MRLLERAAASLGVVSGSPWPGCRRCTSRAPRTRARPRVQTQMVWRRESEQASSYSERASRGAHPSHSIAHRARGSRQPQRSILEERERKRAFALAGHCTWWWTMRGRSSLPGSRQSVGRSAAPAGGSHPITGTTYFLAPTNINHQGGKWVAALPKVRGAALSRCQCTDTDCALAPALRLHALTHTRTQPLLGFSSFIFAHAVPHSVSPALVYPSDAALCARSLCVPACACTPCSPSPFESRSPPWHVERERVHWIDADEHNKWSKLRCLSVCECARLQMCLGAAAFFHPPSESLALGECRSVFPLSHLHIRWWWCGGGACGFIGLGFQRTPPEFIPIASEPLFCGANLVCSLMNFI